MPKAHGTFTRSSENLRVASGDMAISGIANDSGLVRMAALSSNIHALSVAPVEALQDARDHLKTDIVQLNKRIQMVGGPLSYDGSKLVFRLVGLERQLKLIEQQL